jgi:hypothetical protein
MGKENSNSSPPEQRQDSLRIASAQTPPQETATVVVPPPTKAVGGVAVEQPPQGIFWLIPLCAIVLALFHYFRQQAIFRKEYGELAARINGATAYASSTNERTASPGHTYALASRGPTHSLEAEFQSAETRWRHLSIAFPQLVSHTRNSKSLVLVSRPYTTVESVAEMQGVVGTLIRTHLGASRTVVVPAWIAALGEDFDALRHPQLAIANPTFYTFPFFLTWQRRHQWGVLPYATHARIGVVVRKDHPNIDGLRAIEKGYSENLALAKGQESPIWVSDPIHVRWLALLLSIANDDIRALHGNAGATVFDRWKSEPAILSVGAYLHKELLPLACAVLADSSVSADFATKVTPIEPSALEKSGIIGDVANNPWHQNSAVIVDLAIVPEIDPSSTLELLRLPHCVYVPIGIGFSILAWPLIDSDAKTRDWTRDLLRSAGEALVPAKSALSRIGIEIDERLWNSPSANR